jgi:hypothetical protein
MMREHVPLQPPSPSNIREIDRVTQEDERTYLERQVATFEDMERTAATELDQLRSKLGAMKSAAITHRQYAPPDEFRATEDAVRQAGRKHQEALKAGAKYRRALRALTPPPREPEQPRSYHEHFVRIAKAMLPRETFDVIADAAEAAERNSEDSKARELTGAALPALASTRPARARR